MNKSKVLRSAATGIGSIFAIRFATSRALARAKQRHPSQHQPSTTTKE